MESANPQERKFKSMGYRVFDVESDRRVGDLLLGSAKDIGTSDNIQVRISNVANYLEYLRQYMIIHRIDMTSQVVPVRTKKAKDWGTFIERKIRTTAQGTKLVRDGIKNQYYKGEKATFHSATDEEYAKAIDDKIIEETQELIAAPRSKIIEEIADSLEALKASMNFYRIDERAVERVRQSKQVSIKREERARDLKPGSVK